MGDEGAGKKAQLSRLVKSISLVKENNRSDKTSQSRIGIYPSPVVRFQNQDHSNILIRRTETVHLIRTFLNDTEEGCWGYEGAIDVGLTDVAFDAESVSGMSESRFLQVSVHQKVHFVAAEAHFDSFIQCE